MKNRVAYIDFLKFIGLIGIIIAHTRPPQGVSMLRSFDVPLMVTLSALLARKSYANRKSVGQYWISRIKRLLIPTWSFLLFYFVVEYFAILILKPSTPPHEFRFYLNSFLLTRYGIGYVWIILIYLYSALLVPLIDAFSRLRNWSVKLAALFVIYALYEVAYYKGLDNNPFVDTTLFYIIPYGLLTFFGYNWSAISDTAKKSVLIISSLTFAVAAICYARLYGQFQIVGIAKYPPRIYYLSYGIAVTSFLLLSCESVHLKIYHSKIVRFTSARSMDIYLWHVFVLSIVRVLSISLPWFVELFIFYVGSCVIVCAIDFLKSAVRKNASFRFLL